MMRVGVPAPRIIPPAGALLPENVLPEIFQVAVPPLLIAPPLPDAMLLLNVELLIVTVADEAICIPAPLELDVLSPNVVPLPMLSVIVLAAFRAPPVVPLLNWNEDELIVTVAMPVVLIAPPVVVAVLLVKLEFVIFSVSVLTP